MLSKRLKYKQIAVNTRSEKVVRDVVRLEVAALLYLTRTGNSTFISDILEKAPPEQKAVIKSELKQLEQMLRIKAEAVDEA
jgi:hypothetical protein